MQPIAYLFLDGACAEAFTFWAEIFGSEPPEFVPARDQIPDAPADAMLHAALKIGEGWLYGTDDLSGEPVPAMAGVSIALSPGTKAEAERIFAALSAGGEVQQPLIETFFSPAWGLCADRFGVRWMISALA